MNVIQWLLFKTKYWFLNLCENDSKLLKVGRKISLCLQIFSAQKHSQ